MATIGPRKKIDIEVTEGELYLILEALALVIDYCDCDSEDPFRKLLKDLGGND